MPRHLRQRAISGITKRKPVNVDHEPKKVREKKTTTTYGAPTADKKFEIGSVVDHRFNYSTKSLEFQVKHYLNGMQSPTLYWLTWTEMDVFPQYQIFLNKYLFSLNDGMGSTSDESSSEEEETETETEEEEEIPETDIEE